MIHEPKTMLEILQNNTESALLSGSRICLMTIFKNGGLLTYETVEIQPCQ